MSGAMVCSRPNISPVCVHLVRSINFAFGLFGIPGQAINITNLPLSLGNQTQIFHYLTMSSKLIQSLSKSKNMNFINVVASSVWKP